VGVRFIGRFASCDKVASAGLRRLKQQSLPLLGILSTQFRKYETANSAVAKIIAKCPWHGGCSTLGYAYVMANQQFNGGKEK
jgi:hypothetical protein